MTPQELMSMCAAPVGRDGLPRCYPCALADAAERRRLGDMLLKLAEHLHRRGPAENPALWASIRRGSSLLLPEGLTRLLVFLDPEAAATTQQAALQAIEAKCTVVNEAPPRQVQESVVDLANRYLEKVQSGDEEVQTAALAAGAVATAVLARAPEAAALVDLLAASGSRRVKWLAAEIMDDAAAHRTKVRRDGDEIPGLSGARERLRASIQHVVDDKGEA